MLQTPRKPPSTAFKPGWKGGPGRPPGMRNKLSEVALAALGADFAEHGPSVIERVRRTKPHVYLQIVASLLPRQVMVEKVSPLSDLSDDELTMLDEHLAAIRAKLIEQQPEPSDTKQPAEP